MGDSAGQLDKTIEYLAILTLDLSLVNQVRFVLLNLFLWLEQDLVTCSYLHSAREDCHFITLISSSPNFLTLFSRFNVYSQKPELSYCGREFS